MHMKLYHQAAILLGLMLVAAQAAPVSAEKERMGPEVGGAAGTSDMEQSYDPRNGGATDTRNPSLIVTGRDEPNESCGGDSMHHQYPCDMDVDSPVMVAPTDPPVSALDTSSPTYVPTDAPTVATATGEPTPSPTGLPTLLPPTTPSPSSAVPLEPCISTDGTFGVVSGTTETDVTVSYMYELETVPGVTEDMIESSILPQLEKAIVDSVLEEVFPGGCIGTEVGKRHLRVHRRLAVTGITMNPYDLINEEYVCDNSTVTSTNNGCNVIDGQLTLYTTDGQATAEAQTIESIIREKMNNGAYASANDDIVRLVYLDSTPTSPESNTGESTGTDNNGGSTGRGTSNELRVGLFVGLIGGAIIIAGVLYRKKRNRHADDETDMHTTNAGSAMQSQDPTQSINDAGIISYEESAVSYDESGMVMADTGMDSASSDGLGIAT